MANKYSDFIKTTDVHEIVNDMVFPLLNAMRAREAESLSLKN